jgi:N-acyl-D-aspartate/D-glutamate deacylase
VDDLLICGGEVIDGTGAPGRQANVAVRDGRISAIGAAYATPARRVIEARGLVVAPGFIDIKTHSDFNLPICPRAESRVHQGITTELVGSCGFSVAPVPPGRLATVSEYLAPFASPAFKFGEASFAAYLESFPATSTNVAMQVGHNTVRVAVMGLDKRAPTGKEQSAMEGLVEAALDAGAVGVSSGPFTAPGAFAAPDELEALARIAARYGAGYATHVRDESNGVGEAVQEAVGAAQRTDARTRIVHVKVSGTDNWGRANRLLDDLAKARDRGVPIECDHYPYTSALMPLRNVLPLWVQDGGTPRMLERLGEAKVRDDIRQHIAERGLNALGRIPSWDAIRIVVSPAAPEDAGRTIADVAARRGSDPIDALCDILLADRCATRGLVASMAEEDVKAFVSCPWVLVGSDGRAWGSEGALARELPHPRFYGTFPRILGHYSRELGLLDLPHAVHKMTGATAAALRLVDRGVLKEGAAADITVFDPARIADRATVEEPRRYPDGIVHVVVNGVMVIDAGTHTGALPGRVLRRTSAGVR